MLEVESDLIHVSGASTLHVPKGGAAQYELAFLPLQAGVTTGCVMFKDPASGRFSWYIFGYTDTVKHTVWLKIDVFDSFLLRSDTECSFHIFLSLILFARIIRVLVQLHLLLNDKYNIY